MLVQEPKRQRMGSKELAQNKGLPSKRWNWWYSSIVDYRLAHPGCTNREIAAHMGKHENTISGITKTDMFREYEAQRRQAWREQSDANITQRLSEVTLLALDSMKENFVKKRDQIPLEVSRQIAETGLESLGFGPKSQPAVVINNQQNNVLPSSVTTEALEEARMALRAVERRHNAPPVLELEAGPSSDSDGAQDSATESGGSPNAPSIDS